MSINSWELDGIRTSIEATFVDLCDVYRRTGNPDEYGGSSDYVKILSDVKCAIYPFDYFRPKQFELPGGAAVDVMYQSLAVPYNTAIREGDMVDVYTQGIKIHLMTVQRGETDDAFLHAYGSVFDSSGWFELNWHEGSHHS